MVFSNSKIGWRVLSQLVTDILPSVEVVGEEEGWKVRLELIRRWLENRVGAGEESEIYLSTVSSKMVALLKAVDNDGKWLYYSEDTGRVMDFLKDVIGVDKTRSK